MEGFSYLVLVSTTALTGYLGAWGKLIHEKPEVENLVALSF